MFDHVRSVGFGEVNSSSLVDLVPSLEIHLGSNVLDVGSGAGLLILLVSMMHPRVNVIGVEVLNSRHLVAKIIVGGITRHFPHSGYNGQLVSGDVLDPCVNPQITFASVT